MKTLLKGLKTFFLICLSIPFILILLFILLTIGVTIINDINADNYQKDFCKVELPQDTSIIDSEYSIGHFHGNGNGTNYYLSMAIDSKLSLEELEYYFTSLDTSYHVDYLTKSISDTYNLSYDKIVDDDYYIVYTESSPKNEFLYEFDLRGH